jgi:hypothetical protein
MKLLLAVIVSTAFVMLLVVRAPAQNSIDAAETVQTLNAQLQELQDKEADLKIRLEQLEFELKPESIERFFSGTGSTHPEQLRKLRHNQLQLEKDRVVAQLEQLAGSQAGLKAAISSAQATAYQQSAMGALKLSSEDRGSTWMTFARVLTGVVLILLLVGSLVLRVVIRERRQF